MHLELPEPHSSSSVGEPSELPPQVIVGQDTELPLSPREREQMLIADAARYVAEQSERRFRALVEPTTALVWTADANGLVVDMPHWHDLTGLPAADAHGDEWLKAVYADDQDRVRDALATARVLGRPVEFELRLRSPDGSYRWVALKSAPVHGDRDEIIEWVGTWTDVHDRKRAEQDLTLISDASDVLLSGDEPRRMLENFARLLIPRIADVCHIDLVNESTGELYRAVMHHADPAKLEVMHELARRYPPASHPLYASATAARTGQSRLVNDLDDLYYLSLASDEEHLRYIRAIAPRSYVATPLVAHGKTLGSLVVFYAESMRRYGEADVALVQELARRAALAVDVARRSEAERRARVAADAANHAKSDFLAAVSHELRVPLHAIIGYADLMTEEIVGPVAAAQREQLDHITSSARRLIDVANHVLTLSRIESGRESASLGDVDIAALCREALSLVEGEARAKAIDLDVAITGDVGTRRTDYVRLRQILLNLLSNAVHFTEHGRVSLVVRADREWLRFIVRDTGEGISPDHLDHVFERFWQADPTRARTAHGTGLGLAVARDLARLLGGDIGVESVLGQGSTFTVRLPA